MPADPNGPINFDLGVTTKMRRGINVHMYMDRPGEFLLDDGSPASDEQALSVGWDLKTTRLAAERKRRLEEAYAKVEAEMAEAERKIMKDSGATEDELAALRDRKPAASGPRVEWKGPNRKWEVLAADGRSAATGLPNKEAAKAKLKELFPGA